MKRLLSIILSAVLTLSIFCVAPSAAFSDPVGGQCGDSLNWSFDASWGVLTLSGIGRMYDYEDESNPAPWMSSYRTQIKSVVSRFTEL